MALSSFASSFTKNAGTGAQAITGVGFTPKILLMWTAYTSVADTVTNSYSFAWGMSTGAAESHSVSFSSQQGVATSNTSRRGAAKALTVVQYGETTLAECDLTSFDADGFTIDWTTNAGGTQIIHFLCLGGADITAQKVLTFTSPTLTGDKAVTGVGFRPDLLLFARCSPLAALAIPGSAAGAQFAFGMTDRLGRQGALHVQCPDAVAISTPYTTARVIKTDRCIFSTDTAGTTKDDATFSNMGSDGFTLTYATANVADTVGVLAIQGASLPIRVGNFVDTTDPVTGVGFQPSVLLFANTNRADTTFTGNAALCIGVTTGSTANRNQCTVLSDISDGDAGVTNAFGQDSVTKCIQRASTGPNSVLQRDLTSFDTDGFNLSAAISNDLHLYLAMASNLPGGGGIDQGEEG